MPASSLTSSQPWLSAGWFIVHYLWIGAVVCAADTANVKTVLIDGKVMKQDWQLAADLEGPRKLVLESRDYLVSQVSPQEGWLNFPRVSGEVSAATPASFHCRRPW